MKECGYDLNFSVVEKVSERRKCVKNFQIYWPSKVFGSFQICEFYFSFVLSIFLVENVYAIENYFAFYPKLYFVI